jgi:L-lysine exporter family protein LysE/ArgO
MFILAALLFGLIAAIPLGPVNVFVVSQTLKHDFLHGFLAGLTTSVMDTLYCLVALVGLTHISFDLKPYLPYIKVASSVLVLIIGIHLIRTSKKALAKDNQDNALIRSSRPIFGVIALYVSNPSLYAFWLATAGIATAHRWVTNKGWIPVAFAIGCGIGSMIWYLLLVRYVSKHKHKILPSTFQKLLVFIGIALIGFGVYTFIKLFV